ncbi:cytochrome P450 [Massarina eburnea CBS 473.64]|uniref:Cytochrome P450 n=1 Tax=Massarina eburnea CBS 473.64 TaxID=1395130 RepID=A0A6A6RMS1_9PLEO|nr:cytochrome P450 [Massarina eburnea CBS 473.64]
MITLALLTISVALFLYYKHTTTRPPKGLTPVPSPPGLPLIGNAHQLGLFPHRQIITWSQKYGEIFKIRLGWNDWYMLCSPDAVKEVMDRQSKDSSSRAPMPVGSEALSGGMRFLFMEYGAEWRKLRGLSHGLLTPRVSATFRPSQEWESLMLLEEVLKEGEGGEGKGSEVGYRAVRRYTVSVIMTSTYGRRIPEWECDEVREIYGIMSDFSNVAAPGAYLADTLPPLGRLPLRLQWWRKPLKPLFDRQAKLWMSFWTSLKTQMDTKQAPECFVKQVIESKYEKQGISELQAAFLAGSLIEAGSETTSAAINTAILYLSANPEARKRAYEEVLEVVGTSRSPTFNDEENLPYIRAIIKETMRIRPVTNIGTPHYTTAPITYKSHHIPANSIVCIQQYAIHHNPTLFPSPSTFDPSRYLAYPEKSGVYAAGPASERDHWNFGAGRRICSGLHLAENSMFIVLAKLVWAFEILPPLGEDGVVRDVEVGDGAFEKGANTVPRAYRVRWVVRGEEVRDTIVREVGEARRVKVGEEGVGV